MPSGSKTRKKEEEKSEEFYKGIHVVRRKKRRRTNNKAQIAGTANNHVSYAQGPPKNPPKVKGPSAKEKKEGGEKKVTRLCSGGVLRKVKTQLENIGDDGGEYPRMTARACKP